MRVLYSNVTCVPEFIDALVTEFSRALPDDIVSDGIWLGADSDDLRSGVVEVGIDDPESARRGSESARSDIEWAGLGNRARDERPTVNCAASFWTGDDDAKTARDGAFRLMRTCQRALTDDPSVGGVVQHCSVTDVTLRQGMNKNGAVAIALFTVTAKARTVVDGYSPA